MEISELLAWATSGLDEAEAAVVRKALEREAVKAQVSELKAKKDYDVVAAKAAEVDALQQELDAVDPQGNPKGYRAWYKKHGDAVVAQAQSIKAFEDKHGAGTFEKFTKGEFTIPAAAAAVVPGVAMTEAQIQALVDARVAAGAKPATAEADIQRMVDSRIQTAYAPKWSELLEGTGNIVQRHMFAGRKNPIDFKKLSEIASAKNVPLEAAYDEWDKPERDKVTAAATETEITRRVNEEIQKRGAATQFPAGADGTPGALSAHRGTEKFDASALRRDLAASWNSAGSATTN